MLKRVLILCQRKSSTLPSDREKVNTTVEYINNYMGAKFGKDVNY